MLDPQYPPPPGAPPPRLAAPGPDATVYAGLVTAVCLLGGATHVGFIWLFHTVGVTVLSLANIASAMAYVLAALLVRRGHVTPALGVLAVEIICHALAATALIGWDSGFHYYVVLMAPVLIVSPLLGWRMKVPLVAGIWVLYVGMDLLLRRRPPPYALPQAVLDWLHVLNVVSLLFLLTALATYHFLQIRTAEARLRVQATTDPLTHLSNRRHMLELVQKAALSHRRHGRPLAFVLADLDHFKRINDTLGHEAGDTALVAVGVALKAGLRGIDHIARWGGEEFLLALPETPLDEATQVAERLRAQIEQITPAGTREPMSMTFGVTVLHADEPIEQAIARADQALYAGKHAGRNRVVRLSAPA